MRVKRPSRDGTTIEYHPLGEANRRDYDETELEMIRRGNLPGAKQRWHDRRKK